MRSWPIQCRLYCAHEVSTVELSNQNFFHAARSETTAGISISPSVGGVSLGSVPSAPGFVSSQIAKQSPSGRTLLLLKFADLQAKLAICGINSVLGWNVGS